MVGREVRPSFASTAQPRATASYGKYLCVLVLLAGVNDVAEGGNDVYVDASEVEREIPVFGDGVLEGHCFVKKLKELL